MWSYSSKTCIKTARDVKELVYKKCHPQESRCWQDNINTSVAMISQWWLFVDVDVSIDQGCGGQLLAGVRCDHDGSGRWTCQPQAGTRGWHSCRQGVPLLRPLTDWAVLIVHTIRVPGSSSPTLVPLPHRANITTLSFRPLLPLSLHFWGNRTEHKINAYKANKKCCYYKKHNTS